MNNTERICWNTPSTEEYSNYLIRLGQKPLSLNQLTMELTREDARLGLSLMYQGYICAVAQFAVVEYDLRLRSLRQLGNKKDYRVNSTIRWPSLLAHQVVKIVQEPRNNFTRLAAIPITDDEENIKGFNRALEQFNMFVTSAGMRFSDEEGMYIRDIRPGILSQ